MKPSLISLAVLALLCLVAASLQSATPTPAPSPKSASPTATAKTSSPTPTSKSPSPSPASSSSASESPAADRLTEGEKLASPPPRGTPEKLASPSEMRATTTASTPIANNNPPPKPVLYLMVTEPYTVNGKNFIRYRYDVLNKMDYPPEMFAAAPALPPCGLNTNASRTWVDFFDSTGKRLYGFCALSKPEDLGKIWFALEEGVVPPSYVYIELNDRQTNTKYKSNLADTTI